MKSSLIHLAKIDAAAILGDKVSPFFTNIISESNFKWRMFFHLGPYQKKSLLKETIEKSKAQIDFAHQWDINWYAPSFGERIKRHTLCCTGKIGPGERIIKSKIRLSTKQIVFK